MQTTIFRQIDTIGLEAKQILKIDFNGKQIEIALEYFSSVQQWIFDITYQSFIRKGLTLSFATNLLGAYNNILPFGLLCLPSDPKDTVEPFLCDLDQEINDFTLDRVRLYIYSIGEEEALKTQLYNQYGI